MDDDDRRVAFHSALVTEHFVLQSAASSTISEASSRSSLYLLSLSSGLVALGFVSGDGSGTFFAFAATVLPTLHALGWFTVVRLVDTSIENVEALRGIAHIRGYYRGLVPEAPDYFPTLGDDAADASRMVGSTSRRGRLLFTMASMVGTVNAVLGGVIAALLVAAAEPFIGLVVIGLPLVPIAVLVGVLVAAGLLALTFSYQQRRFAAALGSGIGQRQPGSRDS